MVGVGGCWSQSVKDEVFEQFPFVDVAFGPGQVHKLAEFLTSDSLTAQGYFEFEGFTGHLPDEARARVPGLGADLGRLQLRLLVLHRALDARARGRRGRRRARRGGRRLAADGVERGHAARPERQLLRPRPADGSRSDASPSCCAQIDAIDGIERIRYTSPHPKDMSEDVIRAHAELPSRLRAHPPAAAVGLEPAAQGDAPHLHRERYLDRVAMIREHVPDCALTTDIIVGFPGETEEDFAQTLDVVEQVGYDSARSRSSSRRAARPRRRRCPDQIPHEVKRERMERLVEVVQRIAAERAQRFVGRTLEVLVEGPSRTRSGARLRAHAPQQDGATSTASPRPAS